MGEGEACEESVGEKRDVACVGTYREFSCCLEGSHREGFVLGCVFRMLGAHGSALLDELVDVRDEDIVQEFEELDAG